MNDPASSLLGQFESLGSYNKGEHVDSSEVKETKISMRGCIEVSKPSHLCSPRSCFRVEEEEVRKKRRYHREAKYFFKSEFFGINF